MRCYQEIGLKREAVEWLEKNGEKLPAVTCSKCGHVVSTKMNVIKTEHHDSFYDDGPNLRSIKLKNGKIAKEIVQAERWSSGPVAFFCLEVDGRKKFKWNDKEIERYGG